MRLEQKGHCHTEPWHAGTWDTQTWGTHRHGGHTGHTDTYGIHRHTGHMDTWTHGTHGHTGHMDTGDTQTHGCWATFQLTKGCALTELLPLLCSGSVPAQWKWCCVPHGLAGISALLPVEGGGGQRPFTAQHSTAASPLHHILCSKEAAFSSFSPSSSLEDMVPLDDKRCSLCPNSPAKAKPAVRAGGGPGGTPVHGAVPAARSAAGGGWLKEPRAAGTAPSMGAEQAGWPPPHPNRLGSAAAYGGV